jgi:flagellar FliL protein
MSAAAAPATAEAPPKKGKKKLIIILAAVLLLAGMGGGAAFYIMKKKAAEAAAAAAAEEGDAEADAHAKPAAKKDKKGDAHALPVFVPLDMFTVNLADKESERYAQVGVTLEIDDAHTSDQIKAYMPAIRNNILMVLAHKTAAEMQDRDGKLKLAREIRREALRPMGIEVEDDEDEAAPAADTHGEAPKADAKPKKKRKKKAPEDYPIRAVHFSNFIIQ